MAAGSRRVSGFTGAIFGSCGGASTATSPCAVGGTGSRGSRTNSIEQWTLRSPVPFHPQPTQIAARRLPPTGLRWLRGVKWGDCVPDSLCRLTVQLGGDDALDLALPSEMSVGQIMPSIVDLVAERSAAPVTGIRWRLARVGGPALDESMTLDENGIRGGEVLVLTTTEPQPPEWVVYDPSHTVAQVENTSDERSLRMLPVICCLSMGGNSAVALYFSAKPTAAAGDMLIGAALAAASAVAAVVARRALADNLVCMTFSVIAVIFTAAFGMLAVPGDPAAAHILLASSASFSAAILLLRLTGCSTIHLTAIATATLLIAAVAAACVAWRLPGDAAGASLATLALVTLSFAPRFSITITGIGPSTPTVDGPDEPVTDVAARAMVAHQTLTGLVTGSSISAALGVTIVAVGELHDGGSLRAATFSAVIALVLLLRVRTHGGAVRRIALASGGMISVTVCFAIAMVSSPGHAHWVSLLAAAAGATALSPLIGLTVGPVARRAVELADYLALAAVVPAACWVGGLYTMVRGLSLP